MLDTATQASATEDSLLDSDEPSPFSWYNRDGGGPCLIVCDHASARVPGRLGHLGLDAAALGEHVAWDIGAAVVARRLALRFDAPLLLGGYSRLVVDLNRFPHRPASIPEVSDNRVIPGNRDLSGEEVQRRLDALFWPYHRALGDRLAAFEASGVDPCLLSIHSFTPTIDGEDRPWHIGVLWNRDGRLALPLLARLRRHADLCVGDNEPYSATSPLGYTMATHAEGGGYRNLLLEIRQDLIEEESGADEWARILGDAIVPEMT